MRYIVWEFFLVIPKFLNPNNPFFGPVFIPHPFVFFFPVCGQSRIAAMTFTWFLFTDFHAWNTWCWQRSFARWLWTNTVWLHDLSGDLKRPTLLCLLLVINALSDIAVVSYITLSSHVPAMSAILLAHPCPFAPFWCWWKPSQLPLPPTGCLCSFKMLH